jgi:hypothetical protein
VSLSVRRKSNLNNLIMKKSILNLGKALNKAEQKLINGGRLDQAQFDKCRLYINTPDGGGYWSDYVSYEQASSEWNGMEYSGGSYASGYCCASC